MKRLDTLQLAINRHYNVIRLFLLVIIVILAGLLFYEKLSDVQRANRVKDQAVKQVVSDLHHKSDQQTQIIKDQFQALCVIVVQTSGRKGLKKLDPAVQQRCRQALGGRPHGRQATKLTNIRGDL
jgi:hypothetical protein